MTGEGIGNNGMGDLNYPWVGVYFRLYPALEDSGKFTQTAKFRLEYIGRKAGPPRRPFLPLTEEQKNRLKKLLGASNRFSFRSIIHFLF